MLNDHGANQYLTDIDSDKTGGTDPIERAVQIIEMGLEQGVWMAGIVVGKKVHLVQLNTRRMRMH